MTVRKAIQFSVSVDDRPGMLAEVAGQLADSGVNILALAGWSEGAGSATLICVPDDPDKVRQLAGNAGFPVGESEVVVVEGDDRIGVGRDLAQKIAQAGVNIQGCMAQAVGGKYQAVFSVAPQDVDRVVTALGG